jgi:hypothetical protein
MSIYGTTRTSAIGPQKRVVVNRRLVLWRELLDIRWAVGHDGQPLTPERTVKKDDHTVDSLRNAVSAVSNKVFRLRMA